MNWDSVNDFLDGAAETFGNIQGILGSFGINANGSGQSAANTQSQPPGGQIMPMNFFGGTNGIIILIVAVVLILLIVRR